GRTGREHPRGWRRSRALSALTIRGSSRPDLLDSSGRDRRRSGDLALFRRALYQLSYPTAVLTGFEPATSGLTGRRALQTAPQDPAGTPNGIRTRAAALKGRCPRPLDDGGTSHAGATHDSRGLAGFGQDERQHAVTEAPERTCVT